MQITNMNLKNISYSALLAGAATFGAFLAQGRSANAFWSRQAPQSCFTPVAAVTVDGDFAFDFVDSEGCNTKVLSTSLSCPIEDTSTNPKTSITTLNVHTTGNGLSIGATRCVRFWNATGGSCGASSTSSATGSVTLTPPSFINWTASDFGYVHISIPGTNGGNEACLRGLYSAG